MKFLFNKSVGSLLVAAALSLSILPCAGGTADFSKSRLSQIWQQEFSPSVVNQASAETKAPTSSYSANLHYRNDQPHPAVVRVIVPEEGATSYGSGTLIDLRDQFGLVITNWHVVRDAKGMPEVVFPGGFKSKARALKVDPDWDLAALVIWRPPVEPVPIATVAPQPGDELTICGYGSGMYRSATGHCTQYYAPRLDFPRHMVELDVEARQGDSGGPIFNRQGELAGVLFGAGQGTTLGSFGGRVENFLASLAPDIGLKAANPLLATQLPPANRDQLGLQNGSLQNGSRQYPSRQNDISLSGISIPDENAEPLAQILPSADNEPPASQPDDNGWTSPPRTSENLAALWPKETSAKETGAPAAEKPSQVPPPAATAAGQRQVAASHTSFEQMKTVLAAIGLVSIAVLILRAAR